MSLKNKIQFYICFWILFVIHFVDMILTTMYIGDNYIQEDFPVMRYMIQHYGGSNAIWVSRFFTFGLFFIAIQLQERKWVRDIMFLSVLLYIASQWYWPIYLGWIKL